MHALTVNISPSPLLHPVRSGPFRSILFATYAPARFEPPLRAPLTDFATPAKLSKKEVKYQRCFVIKWRWQGQRDRENVRA